MTAPLTLADIAERHRPSRDFFMKQAITEAVAKVLPINLRHRGLGSALQLAMLIFPDTFPHDVLREFKKLTRKYGAAA